MASSIGRLSKMDILAQRQNRIAEKKLSAAITTIDKERAVFAFNHRSLVRELRWELQDVKSSTGHSEEGRPPSQLMNTWTPSRPLVGGLPSITKERTGLGFRGTSIHALPPLREVAARGDMSEDSDEENDRTSDFDLHTLSDRRGTEACSVTEENAKGNEPISPKQAQEQKKNVASPESDSSSQREASADDALVVGKLEEMKRIMNMPTIYQTLELQKQRGLPRHMVSLPPIKLFTDDDVTDEKVLTAMAAKKNEVPTARTLPNLPHLSQSGKMDTGGNASDEARFDHQPPPSKMPFISTSAEPLTNTRRFKDSRRLLTKATSVGTVYKPENIRLVGRSFTKDELTAQHKSLLEQNKSGRELNPARVHMTRLQTRVDNFLSLVNVQQAAQKAQDSGNVQATEQPSAVTSAGAAEGKTTIKTGEKRKGAR